MGALAGWYFFPCPSSPVASSSLFACFSREKKIESVENETSYCPDVASTATQNIRARMHVHLHTKQLQLVLVM